jgi:cyclopropane fatty-acyl-phospholipid synthase-like methyltransferase
MVEAAMVDDDVPSPIDFHDIARAREWEAATIKQKPWRPQFFAAFASVLNARFRNAFTVLELGSGPGHLAESLLRDCAISRYVALDFSAAMHQLARARVAALGANIEFVTQDFRLPDWGRRLGRFDAVVTMHAAHEVRHTRHLINFFAEARKCMKPDGVFLYCDSYAAEGRHRDLFVSSEHQPLALEQAGFHDISKILDMGKMALFSAGAPREPE